jgi:hypothetical protein
MTLAERLASECKFSSGEQLVRGLQSDHHQEGFSPITINVRSHSLNFESNVGFLLVIGERLPSASL